MYVVCTCCLPCVSRCRRAGRRPAVQRARLRAGQQNIVTAYLVLRSRRWWKLLPTVGDVTSHTNPPPPLDRFCVTQDTSPPPLPSTDFRITRYRPPWTDLRGTRNHPPPPWTHFRDTRYRTPSPMPRPGSIFSLQYSILFERECQYQYQTIICIQTVHVL